MQNINVFILLSYLNEITYTKSKKTYDEYISKSGCSFWNQGFSVGVGITSTSAKADLAASMASDIAGGHTAGCTTIGAPEALPLSNGTV